MIRPAAALLALLLAAPALGGAPEAIKLWQEKRFAEARAELERGMAQGDMPSQALLAAILWYGFDGKPERELACRTSVKPAAANEPRALAVLARCHYFGIEVAKDLEKARALARTSAVAGDNEGRFVFYTTVLMDPALRYVIDGKADAAKYNALAARPLEQRTLEVEALDFLARAAENGHRDAQIALAGYFFDTLGERNRAKSRALYAAIQNLPEPLQRIPATLAEADKVAPGSLATVKLLRDAQTTGVFAAMVAAYPPGGPDKKPDDCKDVRFTGARVAVPLENAVYLPHTHPFLLRSYLVRGSWEEDWTYFVCGKDATVRIRFDADGFSGARFTSKQGPFSKPAAK